MVHCGTIFSIEPAPVRIRAEQGVAVVVFEKSFQGGPDGIRLQQGVGGMSLQIDVRVGLRQVVLNHPVHAHVVAAHFFRANDCPYLARQSRCLLHDPGTVRVDHDFVHFRRMVERMDDMLIQGLAAKQAEVLPLDPLTVFLDGDQGYDVEVFRHRVWKLYQSGSKWTILNYSRRPPFQRLATARVRFLFS